MQELAISEKRFEEKLIVFMRCEKYCKNKYIKGKNVNKII